MNNLIFISRHEPTQGQILVANKLGYNGIEKREVIFSDNPILDLLKVGIALSPNYAIAGVFPLVTAVKLLTNGLKLVVFTNKMSSREKSKFLCTGADVISLKEISNLKLSDEEINAQEESDMYVPGSRAV